MEFLFLEEETVSSQKTFLSEFEREFHEKSVDATEKNYFSFLFFFKHKKKTFIRWWSYYKYTIFVCLISIQTFALFHRCFVSIFLFCCVFVQ